MVKINQGLIYLKIFYLSDVNGSLRWATMANIYVRNS
jgi:hypothetical protein